MKIAIVYGNDGSDVRVAKTCRTLVAAGHDVHFIGWDRRPHVEKESKLPGVTCHIVPHSVPTLGWTVSGQVAFTRHATATLLRLKPDVVTAVNEDNVLRVGWLKGIAFKRLVCDVFDSHLDRMSGRPRAVQACEYVVWNLMRRHCDRLIATDDVRHSRFGRLRSRTTVIGNYPPDPGNDLAFQFPTGPAKLFISGTFSKSRGIEQCLAAAEAIPDFEIVAAGWAADEFAEKTFLPHPQVRFLGHLTPRQSLEEAARCDALLAMYAPVSRNQILASPNKIYDALSVGRPVVINSEALVSQWVEDHNVGFRCPYDDVAALTEFLSSLHARRAMLPEYARRARDLFHTGYSWEAMESRLTDLYDELDPTTSSSVPESSQAREPMALERAA